MRRAHTVCIQKRPALSLPLFTRGDADRLGALALERGTRWFPGLPGRAVRCGEAVARGLKMAGQDLRLADPIIGEEAVGCLCVRPVLARERQAGPDRARHALDEFAHALAQTLIHEHASGELALPPRVDRREGGTSPIGDLVPDIESRPIRTRNASSPSPESVGNGERHRSFTFH